MPTEQQRDKLVDCEFVANAAAVDALIALGLVDVIEERGGRAYRISEALCSDDYSPNAALRKRLENALSVREDQT